MIGVHLSRRCRKGVKTVTAEEEYAGMRQVRQTVLCPGPPEEQQRMALWIIRRLLVQFHREWTALRERECDDAWIRAANALLDRYSHQLYDIVCDVKAIVGDEVAVEIRCHSADMIKTTNILVMLGCSEECCRRGDALAREALRHAERCHSLRRAAGAAR